MFCFDNAIIFSPYLYSLAYILADLKQVSVFVKYDVFGFTAEL